MSALYLGVAREQSFPPSPLLSHHPPPSQMRQLQQLSPSKPHINPSVLVIVIILSVVFFCSGVLHILARCLGRRRTRAPAGELHSPGNSIRGQLQHLFSMHDSGVEQVFIDTLPVFLYGSIRGLKDSADCAVCLNEFANEDKLRLLPKCKHAFHMECIDTWLLSNSTCPLCRRSLLPEAEPVSPPSESNRECTAVGLHEEQGNSQPQPSHGSFRGSFRASLRGSFRFITDVVAPLPPAPPPPSVPNPSVTEIQTPPMTPGPTVSVTEPDGSEKLLRVELGKVNTDSRRITRDVGTSRMPRSYSMGSYEYVVDFSSLELAMELTPVSGHAQDWPPAKPTHRSAHSDNIPELVNGSHTPGKEDTFWASRGLDTPTSLSRVREIMTPSPEWRSSPLTFGFQSVSPNSQQEEVTGTNSQQVVTIDHEDCEEHEEIQVLSKVKCSGSYAYAPAEQKEMEISGADDRALDGGAEASQEGSLSLRLFPSEERVEASSLQSTPVSGNAGIQEFVAASRKDKVWEVSVDVTVPPTSSDGSSVGKSPHSKKSSPLNWLRGRGRRLVYSAASPSAGTQSTENEVQ